MRIGVAFNLDNETLLPFISNQNDKDLITNYCKNNVAPAVNTLILSFLKAGQFVRVFTLARENFIIRTDQLEIYAVKEYNEYPIKYLWGVFKNANFIIVTLGRIELTVTTLKGSYLIHLTTVPQPVSNYNRSLS